MSLIQSKSLFFATSIVFILILCSIKPWWRAYRYRQWKKHLNLQQHLKTLDTISASIDGFALSRIARQHNDAYDYVYGEIEPQSFIALLSLTQPNGNTVFYDLGSGTGKAVLACAMVYPVKQACGIEVFPVLDHAANQQLAALNQIANYQTRAESIRFMCENFLDSSLSDATLIFISATGLFGDTWEQLNHKLEQLKQPPIIITTSKKLLSPHFRILHKTRVQMSWGVVNAYIQRYIIDSSALSGYAHSHFVKKD